MNKRGYYVADPENYIQ